MKTTQLYHFLIKMKINLFLLQGLWYISMDLYHSLYPIFIFKVIFVLVFLCKIFFLNSWWKISSSINKYLNYKFKNEIIQTPSNINLRILFFEYKTIFLITASITSIIYELKRKKNVNIFSLNYMLMWFSLLISTFLSCTIFWTNTEHVKFNFLVISNNLCSKYFQ